MLTFQIEKQRHEKTLMGSLQSKWKNALDKLDKVSLKTVSIALSTIMILGTFSLFIKMQNPQMSKQRNLQAAGDDGAFPRSSSAPIILQAAGDTAQLSPSSLAPCTGDYESDAEEPLRHVAPLPAATLPPTASAKFAPPSPVAQTVRRLPMPLNEEQFNVILSTKFTETDCELSIQMDETSGLAAHSNAWLKDKLEKHEFTHVNEHDMKQMRRKGDIWKESMIISKIGRKLRAVLKAEYDCACPKNNGYDRTTGTGAFDFDCRIK